MKSELWPSDRENLKNQFAQESAQKWSIFLLVDYQIGTLIQARLVVQYKEIE